MTKHLLAGVAAMGLMSSVASAQTYPPAPPPPPGTIVTPALPPAPVPVPVPVPSPSTSTTSSTIPRTPNAAHWQDTAHNQADKKGNTVIEKDIHREGIAGSTETHKKIET